MTRVVFCGVGALGSSTLALCRNLAVDLRLVDFDRVESKNLASQWFVKPSLGKNKAEAARLQLANFFGRANVEAFGVRFADTNAAQLLADCALAVDCFDNADSRLALSAACRARGLALVHAGLAADGSIGIVRWDARFVADREDAPGQPTCETGDHLPLIGLVAATLARAIQDFVTDGVCDDYLIARSGVTRTSGDADRAGV